MSTVPSVNTNRRIGTRQPSHHHANRRIAPVTGVSSPKSRCPKPLGASSTYQPISVPCQYQTASPRTIAVPDTA
eukprot:609337-Rhodomonas_salina.1